MESPQPQSPDSHYFTPPRREPMQSTPKKQVVSSDINYPVSPAVERLFKVKDSLSSLNSNIRDDIETRRETQEGKLYDLKENMTRIEKNLNLETRKRVESDKVLQTMLDNKVITVQETLDKKINDKFSQLQVTVDILTKRVSTLEKQLSDEKEKNVKCVQEIRSMVVQQNEDLKGAVEAEKMARLEKEALILKKIGDDAIRVSDRIENECAVREQQIQQVHVALHKMDNERGKLDSDFRQRVVEDMELLHRMIAKEQEARERNEIELANTIDQIILQIQESLKMVSK